MGGAVRHHRDTQTGNIQARVSPYLGADKECTHAKTPHVRPLFMSKILKFKSRGDCKCNQALIVGFGDNDHMIRGLMRFIEMISR
jgi:hypothetical protein